MKTLPELATNLMKEWYESHADKPYPTESERQELARLGKITENQVKAWFANKRNRSFNTRTKLKRLNSNKEIQQQANQILQFNSNDQFRSTTNRNIAIKPRLEPKLDVQQQQQQFSYYHPLVLNASSLFGSSSPKCYDSCCNLQSPNLLGQQQQQQSFYFPHPYLFNTSSSTASLLQPTQLNKQPILFFPSLDLNNNGSASLNLNNTAKIAPQAAKIMNKPSKQTPVTSSQYDQSSCNDYTSQLLSLISQFEPKNDQPQVNHQPQQSINFLNNYPFVLNGSLLNSSLFNQQQQQQQQQTNKCTESCCNPTSSVSPTPSNASSTSFNQSHLTQSERSTPLITYSSGSSLENNEWNLLECSYCSDNLDSTSNSPTNNKTNKKTMSSSNKINTNGSGVSQAWLASYSSKMQQCETPPPIVCPASNLGANQQAQDEQTSDQSTRFKFKCSLKNRYFQSK